MKIIAFAASNSKNSINKQLIEYSSQILDSEEFEILDINDYELPLFSMEREERLGKPKLAQDFFRKIGEADALIISFAEHNGSYTAAFKNLFDWTSRVDMKVYQDKPMVMLSTSPGPGGAKNVLATAVTSAPYFGGNVKADLSIPSFYDNFDMKKGTLSNPEIDDQLKYALSKL